MQNEGFHLTALDQGRALFEPQHGVDPARPETLIVTLLDRLRVWRTRHLYYDLSRVEVIDPVYLRFLNQFARACRTADIRMVCIHMQPGTAFALAAHMDQPPAFETAAGID
ncbi:MAG: hypothetical protein PHQ14_14210 [Chromatiales bacterium]|nr:hypothetical protein [Chromatiales bacterium]